MTERPLANLVEATARGSIMDVAAARHRRALSAIVIFSIVMNVLLLTGPFFMLQIYDRILTSRSMSTLAALSLLALTLYLFYGGFDWIRSRILVRLARAFDQDVAAAAFDHMLSRQRNSASGSIADLRQVQHFIASPAFATLFDVPWFPLYLGVIFLLSPYLGLIAFCGALALLTIAVLNEVITQKPQASIRKLSSDEEKLALTSQRQAETLAAMSMISDVARQWSGYHDERLEHQSKAWDSQSLFATLSKTLRLILQSAILGSGAYLVLHNQMSAGALIAASIIFARALAPLDQSIAHWRSISNARASFGRLREALAEYRAGGIQTKIDLPREELKVSELAVASPGNGEMIIGNVTMPLKAGDGVGIVGASGSGKSSLIKGILGLWPAMGGSVRFDGATLDQWSSAQRGQFIGYLPQDIELLPGSIGHNIARFDPNGASQEIVAAARLAGVHEMIVSMPKGYDTMVGIGGHVLSGGERQRIALARAVYRRPFLVALDEPNSNLDGVSELALSRTIKSLREQGAIVIVVTHRQSVLSELNKMLQLDCGRPVVFGERDNVLAHLREKYSRRMAGGLRVVD